MPGIVGMISPGPANECRSVVRSMAASMQHESFYLSGSFFAPEMGVYGAWVAPEGSFAANQAIVNESKDIALLFAGECFPDQDAAPSGAGPRGGLPPQKQSTWLLNLYEEAGDQFFERLNGLFSGLLIDKRRNRAFLFNDRYGFERLYLAEANGSIYFSSEAKALLRARPEFREFDQEGVAEFLTFGCALGGRTLFRGIRLLPGGALWRFEDGNVSREHYFQPGSWESQPSLAPPAFEARFEETFKRVLPAYSASGSGIGVSLTGGLDTRMIMACWPGGGPKPVCYTFAGPVGETLDTRLAAQVARACGLEHHTLRLGPDFFDGFAGFADRTVYITDGCFGVCGAHEIYLNRQARSLAPIRLTGVFGSEVLRGMSTFKPIGLERSLFSPEFARLVTPARETPASEEHPVTFAAFREIPWNLFGSLAACRSQVSFRTPYLDNRLVALAYQAPPSLRKSPHTALQLIRNNHPLLGKIPTDRVHREEANQLSGKIRWLISAIGFKLDYLYNEGLPHRLVAFDPVFDRLHSAARVFGVHRFLQYRRWFRSPLGPYVRDTLTSSRVLQSPFFDPAFIRQMADGHARGQRNHVREINTVLTLEAVDRLLLRNPAANPPKP